MRLFPSFSVPVVPAISALVLAATPVWAQQAAPQNAPPNTTVTDTKAIGDWTVRCFSVASVSPCDMYQESQETNSHRRVLGFSLAYVPKDDKHVVDIAVPLGISIPAGLIIKTDGYTSPRLGYHHCDQAGCYIEGVMPNDMVASIAKSGPEATVNIQSDDGKAFNIKLSLNGFASAHDAMSALAKTKAKDVPVATAPDAGKK
ncbi:MAG TPA: invasion associated locus B family protein [Rhizomicrobium sp.]|nr:invasion associated locus B family protein [Rhizomicrobium sp.]